MAGEKHFDSMARSSAAKQYSSWVLSSIEFSACACAAMIDREATHAGPLQAQLSGATAAAELWLHSSCAATAATAAPPPSASNIRALTYISTWHVCS